MRLATLAIAAAGLLVALAVANLSTVDTSSGQEPVVIAVDVDPTGNTATSLGTIDTCIETSAGGSLDVDLVVDEVPDDDASGLVLFEVHLYFDHDVLQVPQVNDALLLAANEGSGNISSFSGLGGSVEDEFIVSAIDLVGSVENGGEEHGQGVLARLSVVVDSSAPPGVYPISISNPEARDVLHEAVLTEDFEIIPVSKVIDGFVAVDTPCASLSSANAVGIDVDSSGNSPTALGTIEDCVQVSNGDTLEIDLFVQGVLAIHGFDFSLGYDRSLFRVIGVDVDQMLAASPGSSVLDLSDSLPDSDGFFGARAQDMATVSSAAESGDGVLARVTLEAVGSGISGLIVAIPGVSPILTDFSGTAIEPNDQFRVFTGTILEGAASVDEQCGSAPSPLDIQSPPTNTEEAPTPTATPTDSGTPQADDEIPSTPAIGGDPPDGDDGLGLPAIAGIIVLGIAIAAGGAVSARWAWQRYRPKQQ